MSKLKQIQNDLADARFERARLYHVLSNLEKRISDLEDQQNTVEQAMVIAGVNSDNIASRSGIMALEKEFAKRTGVS